MHPTDLDAVARRKVACFVVVGILCVLRVLVLYVLAVHTHRGRELDQVAHEGRSVARPAAHLQSRGCI
jgi:hypothetical protein